MLSTDDGTISIKSVNVPFIGYFIYNFIILKRINKIKCQYRVGKLVENFKGWKKLNEGVVKTWTKNVKSKAIHKVFKNEYLPTLVKIGKDWSTKTYNEYNKMLATITSDDLKGVIAFFTKKGYKQPNKEIKQMQEDLMGFMDIKSFKNKGDEDKPFNDGIFGIATAKAFISYDIKRNKKFFIDKKRGDMAMKSNTQKVNPNAKVEVAAKMKSDSTSIQTGVKKQQLK